MVPACSDYSKGPGPPELPSSLHRFACRITRQNAGFRMHVHHCLTCPELPSYTYFPFGRGPLGSAADGWTLKARFSDASQRHQLSPHGDTGQPAGGFPQGSSPGLDTLSSAGAYLVLAPHWREKLDNLDCFGLDVLYF